MKKLIARLVAFLVCIAAAVYIYLSVNDAYFHEAVNDFITQSEKFTQNDLVQPDDVEDSTTDGKYIKELAIYLRSFQNLNNEMDTETTKMVGVFDKKSLATPEAIQANVERMEDYRGLIQRNSDAIEKSAEMFMSNVSKLDQEALHIGNINDLKQDFAANKEFRKSIGDVRKTIASYMYAALEFVQSRQTQISFAENGAINFKSEEDQKYFYDLMSVIQQSTMMLKGMLAKDREEFRAGVADFKKAYQQSE